VEELCDVLDSKGRPTGETMKRNDVQKTRNYYLGIHVYIYNSEGMFLVQRRSMNKELNPGAWYLNMGHVISGETSKEAAIREIKEEIGVDIDNKDIEFIDRYKWEKFNHFVDIWFVCKDIDLDNLVLRKDEVIEVMNIPKEELIELLTTTKYRRPRPREYVEIIKSGLDKYSI